MSKFEKTVLIVIGLCLTFAFCGTGMLNKPLHAASTSTNIVALGTSWTNRMLPASGVLGTNQGGTGGTNLAQVFTNVAASVGFVHTLYQMYTHVTLNGVDGGSVTNGGWQAVPLTTIPAGTAQAPNNFGVLDTNNYTVTIPGPANYRYRFIGVGYDCGTMVTRLIDTNTGNIVVSGNPYGSVAVLGAGTSGLSHGAGRLFITNTAVLQLQMQSTTSNPDDGFGKSSGLVGGTGLETYSSLELWREL